jgi:hypothetical protein
LLYSLTPKMVTSVHFYPTTLHIPEGSMHKDLFCMFPTGHSRVISRKPANGLPDHCQITL